MRAELSTHRSDCPDIRRGGVRSSAIGIAAALSAAIGIAALLTIVSTVPPGDSAFARTQPPISITVNRRLKNDRLELPESNLPADTSPNTILPKIAPTPLEAVPDPHVRMTRQARFTLVPAGGSGETPRTLYGQDQVGSVVGHESGYSHICTSTQLERRSSTSIVSGLIRCVGARPENGERAHQRRDHAQEF